MIKGVGVDLVNVPDFAEQLAMPGTHWLDAFTLAERVDAAGRAESLAARWAAKEAFIKAWSATLWGSPPVLDELVHPLIEVVTDAWSRPALRLHGRVAELVPNSLACHLSLSHDGDYAMAYVVLEQA